MDCHIHIVTECGETLQPKHVMNLLRECWQEQGYRVTVGPTRRLDADAGIIHIDRTWVPPSCVPENPGRRPLLNAHILDISKRRISLNLLSRDSNYAGPVIIKTNANSFGKKDRGALPLRRLWTLRQRLVKKGHWRLVRTLPPRDYPVCDHISSVPEWVWKRDDLIVERFLPERDRDEFSMRVWMFVGRRDYGVRLFGRHPVIKTGNVTRYEHIHDVPEQLRRMRAELRIDYGKIDYVMIDGEPVLLDVNTTPTAGARQSSSKDLLYLAGALPELLEQPFEGVI